MTVAIRPASDSFTPRQQAVLTAALDLLVEAGDGLTMTAVARRASCSKETLYKWFGDRGGLLEAGRDARLVQFENSELAFRTFFGLVLRDVQIRLLLGEKLLLTPREIEQDAERATEQFLVLYGAKAK